MGTGKSVAPIGGAEGCHAVDGAAGSDRDADGSPGASPARDPDPNPSAAPAAPEQATYRVLWLARDGRGTGAQAVLRGEEMTRRGPPLTKELLKRWLPEAAECDAIKVSPCQSLLCA